MTTPTAFKERTHLSDHGAYSSLSLEPRFLQGLSSYPCMSCTLMSTCSKCKTLSKKSPYVQKAWKYFFIETFCLWKKGFYNIYLLLGVWWTVLRALSPINGIVENLSTLKTSHSSKLRRAEKKTDDSQNYIDFGEKVSQAAKRKKQEEQFHDL